MLKEYMYVLEDCVNMKLEQNYEVIFKCPNCGNEIHITSDNIEDVLNSEPHDPLEDYIECECGKYYGLFRGIEVLHEGKKKIMFSDGTFIYLGCEGKEVIRIA